MPWRCILSLALAFSVFCCPRSTAQSAPAGPSSAQQKADPKKGETSKQVQNKQGAGQSNQKRGIQAKPKARSKVPRPQVLLMLVRTTLLAINQANQTDDYSVLYRLVSPELKAQTTPDKLAKSFASIRKLNMDLSAVAVLTPQVTEPPTITPSGTLTIKGYFPTNPVRTVFAMGFRNGNGKWRPSAFSISFEK